HQNHVIAALTRGGRGAGADDLVPPDYAQRHDVDQAVVVEALIEDNVAAHIGHAQSIAVLPDAIHHALRHPAHLAGLRPIGVAEAQGIGGGHNRGSHAIDIADDAADARSRALVGEDLAGVVVAL